MRKRFPAALLAVVDVALIAAGVGVFYLYLAVLPRPYEVVTEPTRPVHATAARSAALPASPTPRATSTFTATGSPSLTATRSATAAVSSTTAVHATRPTSAPATATLAAAVVAVPTRTPRPTGMVKPTATPQAPRPTTAVSPPPTPAGPPAGVGELGGGKFAARFTDGAVEQTATSYRSANINVTLTQVQRRGVTYYVQDIYVRYIDNLRAAFAKNTYGRAIADWTPNMANAHAAIGAINGDYYGGGELGAVIRNGKLYHGKPDGEVAVLFTDGTMRIYAPNEFDAQQVMSAGAYQAWDFGPGLMTPEGKAIGVFNSGIAGLHPRTAIGYVEPGHYLFIVVDGRQPGYSNGMTLAQLAALFEELGAKAAYNLDGGQTSVMTFGGAVVNRPYRGGRPTSDIIFVGE